MCKSFYRVFAQPKQTKQNESACDEWAELRKRRLWSWAACATSNVCCCCCCCCSQKYHAQKKRETEREGETVGEQTTKFEESALQCACVTIFGIFCWVRFNIVRVLCGCVCVCAVRARRELFLLLCLCFFSYCVCVRVCWSVAVWESLVAVCSLLKAKTTTTKQRKSFMCWRSPPPPLSLATQGATQLTQRAQVGGRER